MSIWPDRDFNPQAFLREHGMASTFLLGDDKAANEYGIWGVPTYYVIDPRARALTFTFSYLLTPELWERDCEKLLRRRCTKTTTRPQRPYA